MKKISVRGKYFPSSWIGRTIIVRKAIPPKVNSNLTQSQWNANSIPHRTRENNLKIHTELWLSLAKEILDKKNKTRVITIPDLCCNTKQQFFKNYMTLIKKKHACQWKRTEHKEISTDTFNYLIFDQGIKNSHHRKDSLFDQHCRKNWLCIWKRLKLNP